MTPSSHEAGESDAGPSVASKGPGGPQVRVGGSRLKRGPPAQAPQAIRRTPQGPRGLAEVSVGGVSWARGSARYRRARFQGLAGPFDDELGEG